MGKGTRASADTQTNAVEVSPEWRRKKARARKREQDRWASLAGEVTVTKKPEGA